MLHPKDSWPASTGNGTTDRKAVRSFHHQVSRRTPSSEVPLRAVKPDVTFLMDFDGFYSAFRLVNGMVVVDSLAQPDRLMAEIA